MPRVLACKKLGCKNYLNTGEDDDDDDNDNDQSDYDDDSDDETPAQLWKLVWVEKVAGVEKSQAGKAFPNL